MVLDAGQIYKNKRQHYFLSHIKIKSQIKQLTITVCKGAT